MPRSANQKLKLLCLCRILWERTDEDHPLTVPELIQALEAWDIKAERKNIQIFGKSKCFDTKKAERWFKERRIRFQSIDLGKYGISPGELKSVLNAVGLEALVDPKHPDAALLAYLAYDADKVEKLLDNPRLLKTPIVRNGRQATVGYCPEVWQGWA